MGLGYSLLLANIARPTQDRPTSLNESVQRAHCFPWWLPPGPFSFQPVLDDWCNKGRGMCYPVCGMMHIKEPLLLIGKSSLCGGSGFPFSLSEYSLTICVERVIK